MSNVKKRPRPPEEGSNRTIGIPGRTSVERDTDSSHDDKEDDANNPLGLSSLQPKFLRKIFSYATHDQLALELPLVCQKFYEVVCYSDSLWNGMTNWLNQTSPTLPNPQPETVFGQQSKNETDTSQLDFFGIFTVTTNVLRKLRHRKPSSARIKFIAEYRRYICYDNFFREMELERPPPLNRESRALLERFQEGFDVKLPLGFLTLLQRHKVHRYIPHLGYADLKYDALDFIELSSNRILLLWCKDCQDCWGGFVLFDRHDPVPDPPLKQRQDAARRGYNPGVSACVGEYPIIKFPRTVCCSSQAMGMDDANSSVEAEDSEDLLLDNESECNVRKSKRLRTVGNSNRNPTEEDEEEEESVVEYEDFGLGHNDSNGKHSDDSSGEEEWKDTD